jgi:hypothetical protein
MAQFTKQETAVSMANDLITIAQTFRDLRNRIVAYNAKNASVSPDTIWRQMATAAKNADGSNGTTDGTPVLTNTITVGGINRAEADLLPGLTLLLEFDQFVSGTLPTGRAAIDRRAVIDTIAG